MVAQTYSNVNIGIWIGFYQDANDPNYSEPSGGWKWVNQNYYAYKYILTGSNSVEQQLLQFQERISMVMPILDLKV